MMRTRVRLLTYTVIFGPWMLLTAVYGIVTRNLDVWPVVNDWIRIYGINLVPLRDVTEPLALLALGAMVGSLAPRRRGRRSGVRTFQPHVVFREKFFFSFAAVTILIVSVWLIRSLNFATLVAYIAGSGLGREGVADGLSEHGFLGIRIIQSGLVTVFYLSSIGAIYGHGAIGRSSIYRRGYLTLSAISITMLVLNNILLSQRILTLTAVGAVILVWLREKGFSVKLAIAGLSGALLLWMGTEFLTHVASGGREVGPVDYAVQSALFYAVNNFHNLGVVLRDEILWQAPDLGLAAAQLSPLSRVLDVQAKGLAAASPDFGGGTPTLLGLLWADWGMAAPLVVGLGVAILFKVSSSVNSFQRVYSPFILCAVTMGIHSPYIFTEVMLYNAFLLALFVRRRVSRPPALSKV